MENIIRSQFHDIVILLTGWDEPNNGRALHTADLLINGKNETVKYFDDWNRLDEKLDRVTIDSIDKRFVYIPAESGGFLINATTLSKVKLPFKRISTVTFLGNYFFKNILVLVHIDEIILFNTSSGISVRINFPASNIIWSEINNDGDVLVTVIESETKNQTTQKLDYKSLELTR